MSTRANKFGFDETDKPDIDILNDCVHCGFCLSSCPTYIETGNELDSPRGRIYLIKSALEERIPVGDSLVNHLDRCLGCLACETSCPSGVKYRNLIENSRTQIEKKYDRGWKQRLTRSIIFSTLPYSRRMKLLLPLLYLFSRTGVRRIFNYEITRRILPSSILRLVDMAPEVKTFIPRRFPVIARSRTKRRFRVGLLKGCIQQAWFSDINDSTISLLTKNGCDVVIPQTEQCCGALSIHSGRLDEGREFARKIIDEFIKMNVDALIINSAGCGSSVKDYKHLLENDPVYAGKASEISKKTRDIMEFIDDIGLVSRLENTDIKVTYQDACHIIHGQKLKDPPRNLLKQIPGISFTELPGSDNCCGSAGIYNLMQPEMSEKILNRKIDTIESTGADYLAVSNPGCLMQLQKGIRARGLNIKIVHPVEILDNALSSNEGK